MSAIFAVSALQYGQLPKRETAHHSKSIYSLYRGAFIHGGDVSQTRTANENRSIKAI